MSEYDNMLKNYNTHSILHRDFPPRPDKCILCDREGDALYDKPCLTTFPPYDK